MSSSWVHDALMMRSWCAGCLIMIWFYPIIFHNTGNVDADGFVTTCDDATNISCEGCTGYADSLEIIGLSSVSQGEGCCVHTLTLPYIKALLSESSQGHPKPMSTFEMYIKNELESDVSCIPIKRWGRYAKFLVVVPPKAAMSQSTSRFGLCTLSTSNQTHRLYCDGVKCKRVKNKVIKGSKDNPDMCCHLKQLHSELLRTQPHHLHFECVSVGEWSNSGNSLSIYLSRMGQ